MSTTSPQSSMNDHLKTPKIPPAPTLATATTAVDHEGQALPWGSRRACAAELVARGTWAPRAPTAHPAWAVALVMMRLER